MVKVAQRDTQKKRQIKKDARVAKDSTRGLVYLGHIPHGFFEDELRQYFKQHGTVLNVKVGRSKRTGNSKGFAYVEFQNQEVAKIVAETMNNYLMFKRRLIAKYVPPEERPKNLFYGKAMNTTPTNSTSRRRARYFATKHKKIYEKSHFLGTLQTQTKLHKKMARLERHGVKYNLATVE